MHEKINRALSTVALVLGIVLMVVALLYVYRVQSAVSGLGDAFSGGPPPAESTEELVNECWVAEDGDTLEAPGGLDGQPGGVTDWAC